MFIHLWFTGQSVTLGTFGSQPNLVPQTQQSVLQPRLGFCSFLSGVPTAAITVCIHRLPATILHEQVLEQ